MTERFELLEQLGKGGMGVVWKARDLETGEIIALKLLHDLYVDDEEYVARLEREVEIARRIDSPNVVKVLGYGRQEGVPYVAMEYIEGPSLRELLKEKGKLSWEEARVILRQAAEGLAAVHAAGVIHRDIKPSNILIAKDGTVKVADFGIARAGDLTQMTMGMLGTPAYMAPDVETTEQSDVYALGCVLFEMLTGAPPFVSDSQQQVLMRHIREDADLKKLPPDARPIAAWLLAKDVTKRAPSAAVLVATLAGGSHASDGRVGPVRRRKLVAITAASFGVLLIGIVGTAFAVGGGDGGQVPSAEMTSPPPTPTQGTTPSNEGVATPSSESNRASSSPAATATPSQSHPVLAPSPSDSKPADPQPTTEPLITPATTVPSATSATRATAVVATPTVAQPTATPEQPTVVRTTPPSVHFVTPTPGPPSVPSSFGMTVQDPPSWCATVFPGGSPCTDRSYSVRWSYFGSAVIGFHVWGGKCASWTLLATIPDPLANFYQGTFVAGNNYDNLCFGVSAYNAIGESAIVSGFHDGHWGP